MKNSLKYFTSSFVVTFVGLAIGAGVGYIYSGTVQGALTALFLTFILSILEISLSFDNAVVNASILRKMTPLWRHRFITWGMLIAVFGMRIVFPVLIVCVLAQIGPWDALVMAATRPDEYAKTMIMSHTALAGFGGSFLMMVCFGYFFDEGKDLHWIEWLERILIRMGKVSAVEACVCLLVAYGVSLALHTPEEQLSFLVSSIFGVATFVVVDGVGELLHVPDDNMKSLGKASAAMFLYLEILDASFSFDGVIGAFALTNNLFIIAAGLGVGAMFVRSMTIMLVELGTLEQFRYLEHGAFYAIGALASIMYVNVFYSINEIVIGGLGAAIIGVSIISSIRYQKIHQPDASNAK